MSVEFFQTVFLHLFIKVFAFSKKRSFVPALAKSSLNPWSVLSDWNVFVVDGGPFGPHLIVYVNEVTQGRGWPERSNMWLGGWDFEVCDISPTSGEGMGALPITHMGNDFISYTCVMKPHKNSRHQSSGELPGLAVFSSLLLYIIAGNVMYAWGWWKFCIWNPPRLCPVLLFLRLILICFFLL